MTQFIHITIVLIITVSKYSLCSWFKKNPNRPSARMPYQSHLTQLNLDMSLQPEFYILHKIGYAEPFDPRNTSINQGINNDQKQNSPTKLEVPNFSLQKPFNVIKKKARKPTIKNLVSN